MSVEEFRFLKPWSQLLPERATIAVAGHGGSTTTLLRILEVYRERKTRVLFTQTAEHAPPFGLREFVCASEVSAVRDALDAQALAWVGGEPTSEDRYGPLDDERIESLRKEASADIVLVEASGSSGGKLRAVDHTPDWPRTTQLAICTANLGHVGRLWTDEVVEGAPSIAAIDAGEPRRVTSADLSQAIVATLATVPQGARPLPFLTAMGAYRDLDGMFGLVKALWDDPRVPVVVMAELLGDERRDLADLQGLEERFGDHFAESERVYAVYPAVLDD